MGGVEVIKCFMNAGTTINKQKRIKDLRQISELKNPEPMQEYLSKFFNLCKEYQEQLPPHKIAEVLRDYAEKLDS